MRHAAEEKASSMRFNNNAPAGDYMPAYELYNNRFLGHEIVDLVIVKFDFCGALSGLVT